MADEKDPPTPDQDTPPLVHGQTMPGTSGASPGTSNASRVRYGGREYEMPPDVAAAWEAREREFSQKITQQGQELGDLRKVRQEWETTKAAIAGTNKPAPADDLATLWYEDPVKAAARIKAEVREEMTSEYRRDQALARFWDGFYRANDDLKGDEWVVEAQFQRNFSALSDMTVSEAQGKLADITRQEILRLARKRSPDPDARRPLVEPASGDRPPRPAREAEPEGPNSIGDVIRARAARRAKAAQGARGA